MTHQETLLRKAFRDSGLAFKGWTFERAMAIPMIRTVLQLQVSDRQKQHGQPAPIQPALI